MDPAHALRYPVSVENYRIVYKDALPHGVVYGVALPEDGSPPDEVALAGLQPEERRLASTLRGFRQSSFVGGRLAAHAAVAALGGTLTPIGIGPRGEPVGPEGLALSITHKRHLAVALVARMELGELGVDLENLAPERPGVAQQVLRPEEQEQVSALLPERQWTATLLRFSIKEAVYKALAPRLRRYIAFHEASVSLRTNGIANVDLYLETGPTPAHMEARFQWLDRSVLSSVRVRW